MSKYYLGDPCYVIPDDEWTDFCNIMRDDGEDFEYKDETCRVIKQVEMVISEDSPLMQGLLV